MRPIWILLCAAAVLAATTTDAAVVIDASTTIDYVIENDVRIEDGLIVGEERRPEGLDAPEITDLTKRRKAHA